MNKELFKNKMTKQWWQKLSPFFESKECGEIYKQLKETSKKGVNIFPKSEDTFKSFRNCELNNLNAVIVTTIYDENKSCLFLNNSKNLKHFYRTVEKECYKGLGLDLDFTNNLYYLEHQGVLLLSNSLTTNTPKDLWNPFIKYLFENVFKYANIPILFIGENLHYDEYTGDKFQIIPKQNEEWVSDNCFNKIKEIVLKNNNVKLEWIMESCPF